MSDKDICGAKTRNGKPCQKAPVSGRKRCHLHGGKQPRGSDSPNFKHGLYSKYAGESLKEVLSQLEDVSSEDLINPDNEIKLMQALIIKAKALKDGVDELNDLDTISRVIDRLISAKQRSQAIMIEQNRLVPASDIEIFLSWMEELLIKKVGEADTFEIMNKLKSFRISNHEN